MMKRLVAAISLLVLAAAPAFADARAKSRCKDCPAPRPHYDSQEIRKTTRDVDHSRTIETQTVVPVRPRTIRKNHLIIHRNRTRHIGTVRHKHTIVEREIRYVRRPVTTVNYVTHDYRVVRRPWSDPVPRPLYAPGPDCIDGKSGRCESPPLDVRG